MRKMRWTCDKHGCYLSEAYTRLGLFDECFREIPGFGFTDIDGMVECGGRFLYMEWKTNGAALTTGQKITIRAILDRGDFVMIVRGPVDGSDVTGELLSKTGTRKLSSLSEIKAQIRAWFLWAKQFR